MTPDLRSGVRRPIKGGFGNVVDPRRQTSVDNFRTFRILELLFGPGILLGWASKGDAITLQGFIKPPGGDFGPPTFDVQVQEGPNPPRAALLRNAAGRAARRFQPSQKSRAGGPLSSPEGVISSGRITFSKFWPSRALPLHEGPRVGDPRGRPRESGGWPRDPGVATEPRLKGFRDHLRQMTVRACLRHRRSNRASVKLVVRCRSVSRFSDTERFSSPVTPDRCVWETHRVCNDPLFNRTSGSAEPRSLLFLPLGRAAQLLEIDKPKGYRFADSQRFGRSF
jgi:hypothetical protein